MRAYKLILIILLCLTSCKAKQVLVRSEQSDSMLITEQQATEKKDSIRISEHLTEQNITIPGDSIRLSIPIATNDSGNLIPASICVHGERSGIKINVSENSIQAVATCDEYLAKVQVLERTVESYEKETTALNTTVQSREKDISVLKQEKSTLQKTLDGIKKTVKTGIIIAAVISIVAVAFKYGKPILLIIKKLF